MGLSWSSRRRQNHHRQNPSLPQPSPPPAALSSQPQPINPSISSSSEPSRQRLQQSPPPPPSCSFAANAPYSAPQYRNPPPSLYPLPSPSPPPPIPYSYHFNAYNYARPSLPGHSNYPTYYSNQSNGFIPIHPPALPSQPPPYVDHHSAKKIKNDVNVHKDTITVQVDEQNPDCHLVSFTFDALVDGSMTILYFAKEGANCSFTPVYPEIYKPFRMSFQKGSGQKFGQPSGTGIDLGFFAFDDLAKPTTGEDIFPLVISAESSSLSAGEHLDEPQATTPPLHAQITQAVLERKNNDRFQVRVVKQILWIDGVRYELREIYGINNLDVTAANGNNDDSGKECVICMTEPKDTAVLPCRHMCMCGDCAKELRLQSNKCPICRQPIEELIEIKVDEEES